MIRAALYLMAFSLIVFVGYQFYEKRSRVISFEPKDFHIAAPAFSAQEISLARFGKELFEDPAFSANGKVACATCHQAEFSFADNTKLSQGVALTALNSPSALNQFYQKWFFWDGRVDSLEAQALQPIENPDEHGFSRGEVVAVLYSKYRDSYERFFKQGFPLWIREYVESGKTIAYHSLGPGRKKDIDRIFFDFGTAIAQFEKGLIAIDSPFDRFLSSYRPGEDLKFVKGFEKDEWLGFQLFLGKGRCIKCHSGPLLSDQEFHFTGLAENKLPGRSSGISKLLENPYGCLRPHCQGMQLVALEEDKHKVKTPSLRNIEKTAPYFHDGSAPDLKAAITRYTQPHFTVGTAADVRGINLNVVEVDKIRLFLIALTSPITDLSQEGNETSH